ncbi:hypothetical protein ACMHYB_21415 [Sorangium sp. So ce1128]
MNSKITEYDDLDNYRRGVVSRIGIDGCTAHFLSEVTNDLDPIAELLARSFVEREPMTNVFYRKDPKRIYAEMLEAMRSMAHDSATHDCSVILKDHRGHIISTMLHAPYSHATFELPESVAAITSVLKRLSESFDNWIKHRTDNHKILYGLVTAVHPDYAGHGLVQHQLDLALHRAKQLGFSELACATTSVSQFIFARMGLHTIAEIDYNDYEPFKDMCASAPGTRYPIKSAKMMWAKFDEIEINASTAQAVE